MKKWIRSNRKLFIFFITLTLFTGNVLGFALAKNNDKETVGSNGGLETAAAGGQIVPPPVEQTIDGGSWVGEEQKAAAIQETSKAKRSQRLYKVDRYNYSKKDIEELLDNGATIEDIYMSDQLGNEWLIDSKELVRQKLVSRENWKSLETRIRSDKEAKLKRLLQKNAKAEKKLKARKLNTAEMVELLEFVDEKPSGDVDRILDTYEKKGPQGLAELKLDDAAAADATEELPAAEQPKRNTDNSGPGQSTDSGTGSADQLDPLPVQSDKQAVGEVAAQ